MHSEPYSSQRKKSPATCSEMLLRSPGKRKVNAAAFSAILDLTLAVEGELSANAAGFSAILDLTLA